MKEPQRVENHELGVEVFSCLYLDRAGTFARRTCKFRGLSFSVESTWQRFPGVGANPPTGFQNPDAQNPGTTRELVRVPFRSLPYFSVPSCA